MVVVLPKPLSGPPAAEVPLRNAPLVRVIAQVRFPQILSIRSPDKIAGFQDTIRHLYPLLNQETVHQVLLPPDQAQTVGASTETIWRFSEVDQGWRISLGTSFVALETTRYSSRKDFIERLGFLLKSVEEAFDPKQCLRLGLRYIDRVDKPGSEMKSFLNPAMLGIVGHPMASAAQHIITEAVFRTEEEGILQARWGQLPPKATIDPAAVEAIDRPSWILDLDMFTNGSSSFSSTSLQELTERFAERIYTVFRWMVTDEFLRAYGGEF